MSLIKSALICATIYLVVVKGTRYAWIADNVEVFDSCPDIHDNKGILDVFDMSEFNIHYSDGSAACGGNIKCIWEGVQPTDRIQARAELYKLQRGAWQSTTFSATSMDFCKEQFVKDSIWYQVWTRYVPEDERKCLNNIVHVYHHQPYDVDTVFDYVVNMEGRHKIVAHAMAFNELNVKRPKTICFQIVGEFVKAS